MDIFVLIGIAVGLSMDALTVSVTHSTVIRNLELKHGFRMSFFFGLFQMIMPIIGWTAGTSINRYIQHFDHWIAFGLLAYIGGKMIWSGLPMNSKKDDDSRDARDCRHLPTLLMLSIATSIDALAVGLSFAMLGIPVVYPSLLIGVITFFISLAGYIVGKKVGDRLNFKLDIVGGVILIGIGMKILLDHLIHGS